MKPKSSKFKIAFTGTNCSGKTTMALDVTSRLKAQNHYLAEVVSSQDRKITWKDEHFPVDPRAHYGMITNLIHAEVQAELKGDANVVITDRSVLDLYAIACYDHPESKLIKDMEPMILSWVSTYTSIYYLEPLPYQEDGKRPDDSFRLATHAKLLELFDTYKLPNLIKGMDRPEIFKNIKDILNIKGNDDLGEDIKWKAIAENCKVVLAVKDKYSAITSDTDCWVFCNISDTWGQDFNVIDKVKHSALMYFGRNIDVMAVPDNNEMKDLIRNSKNVIFYGE
jgi:hypothetical protein